MSGEGGDRVRLDDLLGAMKFAAESGHGSDPAMTVDTFLWAWAIREAIHVSALQDIADHSDDPASRNIAAAALDGFAEENGDAGSGRGSTTGPRGSGLMPSLDASDGLELRDASSASPPTAEPLPDALDVERLARAMTNVKAEFLRESWPEGWEPVPMAEVAAEYARLASDGAPFPAGANRADSEGER